MENEVKEEVKVETKKKGNGLFTLFACVMTGIIVFLATNIGQKASKTVDPDTPKKNEVTSNVESNTTSNVESNVTSNTTSNVTNNEEAAKTAALSKLKIMLVGSIEQKDNFYETFLDTEIEDLFAGKLTENDKVGFAMGAVDKKDVVKYTYTNGKFSNVSEGQMIIEDVKYADPEEPIYAINASAVAEGYKKLFGTTLAKFVDGPKGCPAYLYDSVNKMYVPRSRCGGAGGSSVLVYVDSSTVTDNTVVITTYVGSKLYSAGENDKIYSDANITKLYKQVAEDSKFVIDETNKTAFTKYNFTFMKAADGEYYFNSIAKAN